MFFTKIGTTLAYIGFVLGVLRLGFGAYVAFGSADMASNSAASQRYLDSFNSGQAMDKGMVMILIAVAFGILCEISRNQVAGEDDFEDDFDE
jgi:hypothetical protein